MERHIRILGIIYIAFGALGILAALFLFVGVTGEGLLSENGETILITASAAIAVAILQKSQRKPSTSSGGMNLARRETK